MWRAMVLCVCMCLCVCAWLQVLLQHGKKLVQEGALTALASVADCSNQLFIKYYDTVMPLLLTILVNANDKVRQLYCLSKLAQLYACPISSVSMFLFDHCILVVVLMQAHWLLRGKALECISLVGMAVGRDRFRADAQRVLQWLQALQATELEADDPTLGYMQQVGTGQGRTAFRLANFATHGDF